MDLFWTVVAGCAFWHVLKFILGSLIGTAAGIWYINNRKK